MQAKHINENKILGGEQQAFITAFHQAPPLFNRDTSPCKWPWSWMSSGPLALTSQVLGLQICVTTPALCDHRDQNQDIMHSGQAFYQVNYSSNTHSVPSALKVSLYSTCFIDVAVNSWSYAQGQNWRQVPPCRALITWNLIRENLLSLDGKKKIPRNKARNLISKGVDTKLSYRKQISVS